MAKQEKLIELVRNYPILFDLAHEDYKNVRKKDKVWTEIGKELGESGDEAKRKWKNIRDSYAKYIRSTKTKTGQAATNTKKWLWADQMESFRPFLSFAKTVSNVGDIDIATSNSQDSVKENTLDGNSTECNENSIHSLSETNLSTDLENDVPYSTPDQCIMDNIRLLPSTPSTSTQTTKSTPVNTTPMKSKVGNKRKPEASSSVGDMIKYFENKKKKEFDAVDCLFLAHAKTLKTFSGKRQVIAKMKIAEVLMEQELIHLQEMSSVNVTLNTNTDTNRPDSANSCQTISSNHSVSVLSAQSPTHYELPPQQLDNSQYHHANTDSQATYTVLSNATTSPPTQEVSISNYIAVFDPYNK